jgi:hypothetical protein
MRTLAIALLVLAGCGGSTRHRLNAAVTREIAIAADDNQQMLAWTSISGVNTQLSPWTLPDVHAH